MGRPEGSSGYNACESAEGHRGQLRITTTSARLGSETCLCNAYRSPQTSVHVSFSQPKHASVHVSSFWTSQPRSGSLGHHVSLHCVPSTAGEVCRCY